jgi:hypothetical protein
MLVPWQRQRQQQQRLCLATFWRVAKGMIVGYEWKMVWYVYTA